MEKLRERTPDPSLRNKKPKGLKSKMRNKGKNI